MALEEEGDGPDPPEDRREQEPPHRDSDSSKFHHHDVDAGGVAQAEGADAAGDDD